MKGTLNNLRILFQNAMIAEFKQKYQNMCSAEDKQVASKMLRSNILKKDGHGKAANSEFGLSAKAMRANEQANKSSILQEKAI
jgi:hypothetical protein